MSLPVVYHKNVLEFVTVAKEYIGLIDLPEETEKKTFVFKAHKILTLLYLKASLLPEITDIYNEGNERFCTEELYNSIQQKIHRFLRTNDYEVLTNHDSQNLDEQEWVRLSEIFADIFQSVYDFLNLYRIGTEAMMNDALYECYNDFKTLWGRKLLLLIESFHRMLYEDLIREDDEEDDPEIKKNPDNWFSDMLKEIQEENHPHHGHHHE